MTIVNAMYEAVYDDYNGGDRVPCMVDTDKMEVVAFQPALESRWYEKSPMCTEEWIQLDSGASFEAIKFDEFNDAVLGGYDSDYDRQRIVLFDADDLAAAMVASFPPKPHVPAFDNYFEHCALLAASADDEDDAYGYAEELAWRGAEHFRDAATLLELAAEAFEASDAPHGFYDDNIAHCQAYSAEFASLYAQAEELVQRMRNEFRFQGLDEDEFWGRD